jgi:hypothetical protein
MKFTKPTADQIEKLAPGNVSANGDGITAYSVAKQVNAWLAEDQIAWTDQKGNRQTEITPQRLYSQFAKKVDEAERNGARFTEAGAKHLAQIAYAHLVKLSRSQASTEVVKA